MLYYFDSRDGKNFLRDDTGVEVTSMQHARDAATIALAELAKDVLKGETRIELAIHVRDETDCNLFRASILFELYDLA